MSIKTMTIDDKIALTRERFPNSKIKMIQFIIDDYEYFHQELKAQGIAENSIDDILDTVNPFQAVYTLIGTDSQSEYYDLTDNGGNKISINSLNGYQKGLIINDCYAYFMGNKKKPHGVIKIIESEIPAA